jgi:hypothetical protein
MQEQAALLLAVELLCSPQLRCCWNKPSERLMELLLVAWMLLLMPCPVS